MSASGGLANAVVSLVAPDSAPPTPAAAGATPGAAVDQKGCTFVPHVQAVRKGATLDIRNSDDVLHNVHATLAGSGRTLFNLAMPRKGLRLSKTLKKPGVVQLRCDAGHTWMRAYVHVFDHPLFAVTGADGSFRIDGVPPGIYEVSVWHEKLGATTGKVTVGPSGTARLSVSF